MNRFFARMGRFFWSWGFLKFVLFVITLIILLYAEEDWRGARAWAATKAKWEAKGETFDFTKFAPPPIPDDQNLAALPIFQIVGENYPGGGSMDELVDFRKASHRENPNVTVPILAHANEIREAAVNDFEVLFKGQTPPADALAQFDAIFPFAADVRVASATHPDFRLNVDYDVMPPTGRPLGPLTDTIALAKILTWHAVLALDEKRPDLALGDIKTNTIIAKGAGRDPDLVGGLVSIGILAISNGAVDHGLAQHEWSDAQLAGIEQDYQPIDLLTNYQFTMRAEAALVTTNVGFFKKLSKKKPRIVTNSDFVQANLPVIWPGGWWDNNSRQLADFFFAEVATVNPQSRQAFPKAADNLDEGAKHEAESWVCWAPWNFWFTAAAPVMSDQLRKFAQGQVSVDERCIACALERYRLARGTYPSALDALAPAYIEAVPRDVMNGEPYHYRLNADGTFLLYSVGWNQVDDGGKEVDEPGTTHRDYTQGDWVWPTPKR